MDHFTLAQWTEFERGEAKAPRKRAMLEHLDSGCAECERILGVARRIAASSSTAIPMELAFDSGLAPARADDRGGGDSRRVIYYSEGLVLDLSIEKTRAGGVVVAGQIERRQEGPQQAVPAFLLTDSRIVSEASTGRVGDFEMTCQATDSLRLCLLINDAINLGLDLAPSQAAPLS